MHCLVAAPIAMLSILISLHAAWGTEITVSATRFLSIPLAVNGQTGFYVGANAGRAWSITDCAFFIGASSDPTSQNSPTCIVGAQLGYLYELDPNWAVGLEVSWSGTIKVSKHDQFVSSGFAAQETVKCADIQTVARLHVPRSQPSIM
jgi:opacity protein-like surface antigen